MEQFGSSLIQGNINKKDNLSYRLLAGDYVLTKDVIFPENGVTFDSDVKISIAENISIYIRGNFWYRYKNKPIIIKNINGKPFGSFAIKGKTIKPAKVNIDNFTLAAVLKNN